jgi:hypothetical protein
MKRKLFLISFFLFMISTLFSQNGNKYVGKFGIDTIAPVGIIKNISDSELLDIVQRQTFRFFWHDAHPVSGLARERDNTVKAEYYWDYINEAIMSLTSAKILSGRKPVL